MRAGGRGRELTQERHRAMRSGVVLPGPFLMSPEGQFPVSLDKLFTWRQQLHRRASSPAAIDGPAAFVPVLLAEDGPAPAEAVGRMEIVLGPVVVRVGADVDAAALRRVLEAVRGLP